MLRTKQVAFKNTTAIEQMKSRQQAQQVQQPVSYQTTAQPVAQRPMQVDYYTTNSIADKKARNKERWEKAGVIGSCGLGAAMVIMALIGLLNYGNNRQKIAAEMSKLAAETEYYIKAAKQTMEEQGKELVHTKINWQDFKVNKSSVAPLNSKSTNKNLKQKISALVENLKFSSKEHDLWAGYSDSADIIYLYGHGGTGKTYVTEQFANELDALYACIKYPDLGSPYKDAASMKIANFYEQVKEMALKNKDRKIVICIDEIDALIRKVNDAAHGAEEAGKARSAVLTGFDVLRKECDNVIAFATTNYHPDSGLIDPIVKRRINQKIEVGLPDAEQIMGMLELGLKSTNAIPKDFFKSSELKTFVDGLVRDGYSNGEIALAITNAIKSFRASIIKVPAQELKNHKFTIDFLIKGIKDVGQAASKTNKLMDVSITTEAAKNAQQDFIKSLFQQLFANAS